MWCVSYFLEVFPMIATVDFILDNVESVEVTTSSNYSVVELYMNDGCTVQQQVFRNKQLTSVYEWDAQCETVPSPIQLIRLLQEDIFFANED